MLRKRIERTKADMDDKWMIFLIIGFSIIPEMAVALLMG
tara:strand:- start:2454 stop:2570 length:117 start_codon:yes stop_codon:yes gene_type:complete